jgi:hypothetical protein
MGVTTHRVKTQQVTDDGVNDVPTSSSLLVLLKSQGWYPWCWTYICQMIVGEEALTLELMVNCITRLT